MRIKLPSKKRKPFKYLGLQRKFLWYPKIIKDWDRGRVVGVYIVWLQFVETTDYEDFYFE